MNRLIAYCSVVAPLVLALPVHASDRTVIQSPAPDYPADAKQQKVEGCAIVRYVVQPNGRTDRVAVVDAQPGGVFEKQAIHAVNHWKYAESAEPSYHIQTFYFQLKPAKNADVERCALPETYRGHVVPAS